MEHEYNDKDRMMAKPKNNYSLNHLLHRHQQFQHQSCSLRKQLKAVLLVVTLISVYYHGFYLIISCSFLNPTSIVQAIEFNNVSNKDARVTMVPDYYHDHIHDLNENEEHNDLIQTLQHHKHNEFHRQKQSQSQLYHNNLYPNQREFTKATFQQANDILTKLMYSQGQTDEEVVLDDNNNNKVADEQNTEHDQSIILLDDGGRLQTLPFQQPSSSPHGKMQMGKRYALFTTNRKGRTGLKKVKGGTNHKGEIEDRGSPSRKYDNNINATDNTGITCKDEVGNSVSWLIGYKLPQIPSSKDPLIKEGSKYFYIIPGANSWISSSYPIHNATSILGKTLEVLWENDTNATGVEIAKIFYNDQPPSMPAIVMNGHTKGLILASAKGGVWLQHSCPHFPDPSAQNFSASYPPGGHINAQMFFCMSLSNTSAVDEIGKALQYTKPFVYNHSIPSNLTTLLPELTKVAEQNATVTKAPFLHIYEMETLGSNNLNIKVFAKGPKFRRDVYSWIAENYNTGLDVESWLNGAHPLLSNCTSTVHPILNVVKTNFGGVNFSYADDHSKWGVSSTKETPITCIGDLNRMKPQKTRGGVTICFKNEIIWTAFKSNIVQTQPCNSTSLKAFSVPKYHYNSTKGKLNSTNIR